MKGLVLAMLLTTLAWSAQAAQTDPAEALAIAETALAANALEEAEEAVEAGLRAAPTGSVLERDLLNQAAALRLMRSDWLGAYALLLDAERSLPEGEPLPLEGALNLLRALLGLPDSWEEDLRLKPAAAAAATRGAASRSLESGAMLRRAQLSLRRLARNAQLSERLDALEARMAGPEGAEQGALNLSYAELLSRFSESLSGAAAAELEAREARALVRAEAVGREQGDDRLRSFALGMQGEAAHRRGDQATAETLYGLALILAERSGALEARYRWRWRLGEQALARGAHGEAEHHLALAVSLLGETRGRLPSRSSDLFLRTMVPVYERYVDVLLQQATRAQGAERAAYLGRVQGVLEAQRTAEVEDYFARQCVTQNETGELGPGSAALYPILLEDRLTLLLRRDEGYRMETVAVPRERVRDVATAFRLAIEQGEDPKAGREDGQALYNWLLAPLEKTGALQGIQTLLVIPDGVLRTIPLAALHDGQQYLLERYAFVTVPALALAQRGERPDREAAPALLVGGLSDAVQGFSPLPGVAREVSLLESRFSADVVFNQAFSETAVRRRFAEGDYRIAHFATHGTFSSDHRQSFLLTYEDVLSLRALESLLGGDDQPPLDLLMLSACQTAAGDERAALGLAGVAVQAGARSAVASLWFISDAATAALVEAFYEGVFQRGLGKAEALRQAQLTLLRQKAFSAPSYWAPYLLVGANQ
jgi:CHAT domain-containing protein